MSPEGDYVSFKDLPLTEYQEKAQRAYTPMIFDFNPEWWKGVTGEYGANTHYVLLQSLRRLGIYEPIIDVTYKETNATSIAGNWNRAPIRSIPTVCFRSPDYVGHPAHIESAILLSAELNDGYGLINHLCFDNPENIMWGVDWVQAWVDLWNALTALTLEERQQYGLSAYTMAVTDMLTWQGEDKVSEEAFTAMAALKEQEPLQATIILRVNDKINDTLSFNLKEKICGSSNCRNYGGFVVNDFEQLSAYEDNLTRRRSEENTLFYMALAPYFKRIDILAEKGVLLFRNTVGQLLKIYALHLQSEIKKRMSYDYFSNWADAKGLLFHKYSGVMMNDEVKNLDFDEVYKKYRG